MWEMNTMERRYSVPPSTLSDPSGRYRTTEDLHAWSIYRQNLNSDFTDSALGTSDKSPPPFGNFQLRESTVQTILNHPKYGPRERQSELGANIYSYLRFGLPRVMPPSRPTHRDGSSGYDSSDDGSPYLDQRRRTRSDPDFRQYIIRQEEPPVEDIYGYQQHQRGGRRLKASSEADLLNPDVSYGRRMSRQHVMRTQQGSRDGYQRDPMPGERRSHAGSKAGSHISVASRSSHRNRGDQRPDGHEALPLGEKMYSPHKTASVYSGLQGDDGITALKHPHLQVRDLAYELDMSSIWNRLCGGARTKLRLLDGLSFEARGGEILAIMASSEAEGTSVLDVLSNRHRKWSSRLRGDILINGLFMTPAKMEQCVAYVTKNPDLTPDMSARQTLLFTSLLQEPSGNTSFDTKSRINALLEDLGLSQVKHTRVRDLTEAEKRRLNVACHLLLDTDIILLDQPTKGMDIFDTFFMMEYLRQWAARGRIVILTIHPPTYEIFTMISRVALVSTGRLLYYGRRKDMLSYFAYIDFPCPAYKNPSDYYLDLVTLDNLSAEAMLESSQRTESLVDIFRRRQEALSDPGPPGYPPRAIKRANFCSQVLALWIRVLIYMFPFNVISFCHDVIVAALMSVLVGAIYWNVRAGREQEHVMDRIGFYYVISAVALWPLILCTITDVWREKTSVSRDLKDRLYWRICYVMSKLTYSLPVAAAVFLSYIAPAYSMAGLQSDGRPGAFGAYIGYLLLYLLTVRMLAMAFAWACSSRHVAATWTGLLMTLFLLAGGYSVHYNDLPVVSFWLQWVSPMRWMVEQSVLWEFSNLDSKYSCTKNPVVHQENAILVRAECGIGTDLDALKLHHFRTNWPVYQPILITVAFHGICLVLALAAFVTTRQYPKLSRRFRPR